MSLVPAGSFRKYRESNRCVDCGRRGTLREDFKDWREHRRWVGAHNEWHATASDDELREHEERETMGHVLANRFLDTVLMPELLRRPFFEPPKEKP